jgi:hypothetical protein
MLKKVGFVTRIYILESLFDYTTDRKAEACIFDYRKA